MEAQFNIVKPLPAGGSLKVLEVRQRTNAECVQDGVAKHVSSME
jgi:hypothetical protein